MKQIPVLLVVVSVSLSVMGTFGKDSNNGSNNNEIGKPTIACSPKKPFRPRSCIDYLQRGERRCGIYKVYDAAGQSFAVYCDMNSEPGFAWTLVMSWSTANRYLEQFRRRKLFYTFPLNENSPNWKMYRQSLKQMLSLKSRSTHWRATCSFPTHGVDYTDYVRGNFKDFDIMPFNSRSQSCQKVELINIRGHVGYWTTAMFLQHGSDYMLHVESSASGCLFKAASGAAHSEDNFGYYQNINPKFRCTSGSQATTQWWFGSHL